jgi:hypothetical protein
MADQMAQDHTLGAADPFGGCGRLKRLGRGHEPSRHLVKRVSAPNIAEIALVSCFSLSSYLVS